MARRSLAAVLLVALACRTSEPTISPDEIEARGREVRERLAAECDAGDESACRRLAGAEREPLNDPAPGPETAPAREARTLELDSWPGGAAGLFLAASPDQVASDCAELGGTAIPVRADQTPVERPDLVNDGGVILCMDRRKHDPLRRLDRTDAFLLLTTERAMVEFCLLEDQLSSCAIHLAFEDTSAHFASELRRKLEERFGPMDPSDADFNCRIASERANTFRGMWLWATTKLDDSGKLFPVGSLILNYGCTPIVEHPEPFLTIRDTLGMYRELGMLRGGKLID